METMTTVIPRTLTVKSRYQVTLGCDLCAVAWYSPEINESLETVLQMSAKAFCPQCTACGHHGDPDLRVTPVVLHVEDLDNEFAIISPF